MVQKRSIDFCIRTSQSPPSKYDEYCQSLKKKINSKKFQFLPFTPSTIRDALVFLLMSGQSRSSWDFRLVFTTLDKAL